jgi:hypothetical protein
MNKINTINSLSKNKYSSEIQKEVDNYSEKYSEILECERRVQKFKDIYKQKF